MIDENLFSIPSKGAFSFNPGYRGGEFLTGG